MKSMHNISPGFTDRYWKKIYIMTIKALKRRNIETVAQE